MVETRRRRGPVDAVGAPTRPVRPQAGDRLDGDRLQIVRESGSGGQGDDDQSNGRAQRGRVARREVKEKIAEENKADKEDKENKNGVGGLAYENVLPVEFLPLVEDDLIGGNNEKERENRNKRRRSGDGFGGLVIHKRMSMQRRNAGAEEGGGAKKEGGDVNKEGGDVNKEESKKEDVKREDATAGENQEASPDDVLGGLPSMPTVPTVPTVSHASKKGRIANNGRRKKNNKRTHRTRSRVAGMSNNSLACSLGGDSHDDSNLEVLHQDRQQEDTTPLTIDCLPDDCLRLIFHHCATEAQRSSVLPQHNPLLSTLPLVCKRWREVLSGPSDAWSESTLVIDMSYRLDYPVLQRFMEARAPSVKSLRLTNEKRVIRTTAQRGRWVTMLSSLDTTVTSQLERLRIDDARVFDLIDFFTLGGHQMAGDGGDRDGNDGRERDRDGDLSAISAALANLRTLDLRGLLTLPKRFTDFFNALPRIERLGLSFDALVTDGVPAFDGCQVGAVPEGLFSAKLKSLAIKCKYVTSVPWDWLDRMEALEELRLEGMVYRQIFPCSKTLRHVKKLVLTGSAGFFGKEPATWSTGPTSFPSGSHGDTDMTNDFAASVLGHARIIAPPSATERMFVLLKSMPALEELVIDWCGIREIPMAGDFPASDTVKRISMNNNPDMVFKKGLSYFQGLEELEMRRCNMPCVSSAITSLAKLRYLDVSNNGLVECHNLGKLKALETLVASTNPFPAIPRDVLGMQSLRSIDLSGCAYLEFNADLLHLMSAWPKLVRLDMRKCVEGKVRADGAVWQRASTRWLENLREAWEPTTLVLF